MSYVISIFGESKVFFFVNMMVYFSLAFVDHLQTLGLMPLGFLPKLSVVFHFHY